MTATTTECRHTRIEVRIGYDDTWYGRPPQDEWDTMYEVVHFSRGFHQYEDHDTTLACIQEDDEGPCDLLPWEERHNPRSPYFQHKFLGNPRIAWTLHGYSDNQNTRYWLGQPWNEDYINEDERVGGVMVVKDQFWDEYSQATEEQRRSIAEGELKEYCYWANGEVYWFSAVKITEMDEDCECCNRPLDDIEEEIDGCGGIFGHDYLEESIKEALGDEEYEEVYVYS